VYGYRAEVGIVFPRSLRALRKALNELQSFGTTRLPYGATPMDRGASTLHNGRLYIFFGDSGPSFDKPIGVIPQLTGDSSDFADLGHHNQNRSHRAL
jgi:hypothetical protein